MIIGKCLYSIFKHCLILLRFYSFPILCAFCKKFLLEDTVLCEECNKKIFPIVSKKVDVTPSFSMNVFAVSDYKDPLKKLILAKSYSDSVMSYQLGRIMVERLPLEHIDYDIVVPIPLHWTRYARRGFNQAEEIAKVIGTKKNKPVISLLKRIKKTPFQSVLPSNARAANVKDAFVLHKKAYNYQGKHILLVDDLMTTGATLRSVAKILLSLKPRKITVVVACRVI